jgi:trigger factor
LPESRVRLDIVADEAEFAQAVERAARKVSREVQLPGFRKGKVPRSMIERMFGREVFLEEAHKIIMDELYRQALTQEELVPVGQPEVEITEPDPIAFSVTVPVYPTADPGDYLSVRVEPEDAAVEEGAVEEVLERLQRASSPWVDPAEPRTPREGDQVTLDIVTAENDAPFQDPVEDAVFVLGESQLFDELRALVETLEVGQQGTTVVTFAEDDEEVSPQVRGKTLTYTVTLKGLKERELLELDDDFAKTYAGEESLAALRTAIARDLHQGRTTELRNEVVSRIIDQIAEGATVEIPAEMVDEALTEEIARVRQRLTMQRTSLEAYLRANDQTEEELMEELRPSVAKRLRNSLILREIADREGIAVSDEEIEAEINTVTSAAPNAEQLRQLYSGDRYMRSVIRNELYDEQLTNRLIAIATEGRGAVINGYDEGLYPEPEPPATTGDPGDELPSADEAGLPSSETAPAAGTGASAASEAPPADAAEPANAGAGLSDAGSEPSDEPMEELATVAAEDAAEDDAVDGPVGETAASATGATEDATENVEGATGGPEALGTVPDLTAEPGTIGE